MPPLESLERISGELGVGLYFVVLNETRECGQCRRLEKPKFRTSAFEQAGGSWLLDYLYLMPRRLALAR